MKNRNQRSAALPGTGNSARKKPLVTPIVQPIFSNPPMIEQPIAPPAHVWSKIEQILDQQDRLKHQSNPVVFEAHKPVHSKRMFFASAGVTLLALVVWMVK